MGGGSPERVSTPAGAVFLSYASQDAEAAQKICDAFRAAGIEVWFDKSELRGGDVWDRQIREQIHNCRLFIPVISANTEARDEGYFRPEWGLATDRTPASRSTRSSGTYWLITAAESPSPSVALGWITSAEYITPVWSTRT
jgi:hypothetical protein